MKVLLSVVKPPAEPVKACRGCLDTEITLYDLFKTNIYSENDLVKIFSEFTGNSVFPSDGYPQYICKLCLFLLQKFVKFRHRCIKAMYLLQQLEAEVGVITTDNIKELNREELKHNISCTTTLTVDAIDSNIVPENTSGEQNDEIFDEQDVLDDPQDSDDECKIEEALPIKLELTLPDTNVSLMTDSDNVLDEFLIITKKETVFDDAVEISSTEEEPAASKKNPKIKRTLKRKLEKQKDEKKSPFIKYRKHFENSDEITDFDENCKKRIEEIKNDIRAGKCRKRSLINYIIYVKKMLSEAKECDIEISFSTKEEQIEALEEIRSSETFKNAQYKCEKCCTIYRTPQILAQHNVMHNLNRSKYVCEICEVRFIKNIQLIKHVHKCHLTKAICKICGIHVTDCYRTHHDLHQGKHAIYKCEQCDKQFPLKQQYKVHVFRAHGGYLEGPECYLCDDGRIFINEKRLRVHVLRAHKTNPRCLSCKVVFADSDALTVHGNASGGCHTGYSFCPKCGNNFTNGNEMKTHINEVHMKNYFKCNECPRQYRNKALLESHVRHHVRPDLGSEHKRTREARRKSGKPNKKIISAHCGKIACHICGKLISLSSFKIHMRVHTGEKPYQCDYCKKRFRQISNIKKHIAMHNGVKKYKCQLCEKSFSQDTHLKTHLVFHTKEKAYECPICKKRFGYKSTVREHVRTVHEGLPPFKRNRLVKRSKEDTKAKIPT